MCTAPVAARVARLITEPAGKNPLIVARSRGPLSRCRTMAIGGPPMAVAVPISPDIRPASSTDRRRGVGTKPRRRLAHQPERLPALDPHIDAVERGQAPAAMAERLGHAADFERGRGSGRAIGPRVGGGGVGEGRLRHGRAPRSSGRRPNARPRRTSDGAALSAGTIAGAALDVWWAGPPHAPSRLPFHTLPNVVMTPHNSGHTGETFAARATDIAANIDRLEAGRPLSNVVRAGRVSAVPGGPAVESA
ncbi:NAD(P)-dependent oxidoreductase [Streptomyces violaceusniger]|uniref:NAD(P)-dependent oxidoreductase n=1 Tax=Streptomyces violaceusniger TaxID=68280 RepID=UPI003CD05708